MPPHDQPDPSDLPEAPTPDLAHLPTVDLIGRARDGGREAWGEFYRRYRGFLVACVKARHHELWAHAEVEDVVHDVFLQVQEAIARHGYSEEAHFRPWLRTLVLNRFADQWRRRDVRRADVMDTSAERAAGEERWADQSFTKLVEDRDELERVYRALGQLEDADRDAIIARNAERKDWGSIGEILGCGRTAAKRRYQAAWDRLNRILEGGRGR